MKKFLRTLTTAVVLSSMFVVSSCGGSQEEQPTDASASGDGVTVTVGATAVPHAEILNLVKDDLAAEGVNLVVKEYTDYSLINPSTVDGSLDANFFQHTPFLEEFNAQSEEKLVSVGPVHIEPIGVYSNTIKSLDELEDGAKIGIPNDPSNEQRALILLEDNGLIKLKDRNSTGITPLDIVENPKNIEFVELEAAQLTRTMDEFDAAVINTNFAVEAGLNPATDSIVIEDGANSPYANILVVPEGHENDEAIQKVYTALTSDKVRQYIEENYGGAILAAF